MKNLIELWKEAEKYGKVTLKNCVSNSKYICVIVNEDKKQKIIHTSGICNSPEEAVEKAIYWADIQNWSMKTISPGKSNYAI